MSALAAVAAIPATERQEWQAYGVALQQTHTEMTAAQTQCGLPAHERDTAGFTARGLAVALDTYRTVTATPHQANRWTEYDHLVRADLRGGRYREAVREGLRLALALLDASAPAVIG